MRLSIAQVKMALCIRLSLFLEKSDFEEEVSPDILTQSFNLFLRRFYFSVRLY
jgi:hypothetical protein